MEDLERRKRELNEIINRMEDCIEYMKQFTGPEVYPDKRHQWIKGIQKARKIIQECVEELVRLEKQ